METRQVIGLLCQYEFLINCGQPLHQASLPAQEFPNNTVLFWFFFFRKKPNTVSLKFSFKLWPFLSWKYLCKCNQVDANRNKGLCSVDLWSAKIDALATKVIH